MTEETRSISLSVCVQQNPLDVVSGRPDPPVLVRGKSVDLWVRTRETHLVKEFPTSNVSNLDSKLGSRKRNSECRTEGSLIGVEKAISTSEKGDTYFVRRGFGDRLRRRWRPHPWSAFRLPPRTTVTGHRETGWGAGQQVESSLLPDLLRS